MVHLLRVLWRLTRLSAAVPPASRVPTPLEGHQNGTWKRRTVNTNSIKLYRRYASIDRLNRVDMQLAASLLSEYSSTPAVNILLFSCTITRFRGKT